MARGLEVTLYPEDHGHDLNSTWGRRICRSCSCVRPHRRAVAAYNAGPSPVRALARPAGANDPDRSIEVIPYPRPAAMSDSLEKSRVVQCLVQTVETPLKGTFRAPGLFARPRSARHATMQEAERIKGKVKVVQ